MNPDALAHLVAAVGDATAGLEPPGHAELLQAAVDVARELFSAAACSIAVVDEQGDALVYRVASGAGSEQIVGVSLPLGRGLAGWVASSGSIIAVEDVANDPRFARDIAEETGYVPRGILAAPLENHDQVIGVLSILDRRTPADASEAHRDMALLGLIARQTALSLEAGMVFRESARLLANALATLADDDDVVAALDEVADREPSVVRNDLATLAVMFARLRDIDPLMAELAAETVESFTAVARRRAAW